VAAQQSGPSVALTQANFDPTTGTLSLTFAYSQDLTDSTLAVGFAFPAAAPFLNAQNASAQTVLGRDDANLSLDAFPDSAYAAARLLYAVGLALSAAALLLFVAGFAGRKIVALELIAVFQVAYLSLAAVDGLAPTAHALSGLGLSCGYALAWGEASAVGRFAALRLRTLFFGNYNLAFVLVLLPLTASLVVTIALKVKRRNASSKLKSLASLMRG
jgi:hypothetical protein